MSRYYQMSNQEVIGQMAVLHRLGGDLFWMQVDRHARTMTDTQTGASWPIPDDWNLS